MSATSTGSPEILEGAPPLSPRQLTSIDLAETHTIALWVGAVSAGKTFASLLAFVLALRKVREGGTIVIVGRTIDTIYRNIIRPLQDGALFGPVAVTVEYTRGASTARILGRDIELIGAPNKLAEGRIRGGTFSLVYVDEATLLDREFFTMLTTRLREPGSRMLATTNPGSRRHWLRVDFILNAADHDMVVFYLTMRDNPALPIEYIRRMARSLSGVFYQRMFLGRWTTAEGAIYDRWNPDTMVIRWGDMPPIARLLGVGIDYGTSNATSAILAGITAEPIPRLILIDEWRHDSTLEGEGGRMAPSVQSAHIRAWLNLPHVPDLNPAWGARIPHVLVDPAAADIRAQLGTDGVSTTKANNDVGKGIGTVSSLISDGRLLVTDRCKGFIDEVTEYRWDPKKSDEGLDEPVKERDHSLDAARYILHTTRPLWRSLIYPRVTLTGRRAA